MPELPDLTVYLEALQSRIVGRRLERVRVVSPSLLRTVNPPLTQASGKIVHEIRRIGKQLVFVLEDDLFLVVHLMIAGRFQWRPLAVKTPGKIGLAAFDFAHGTLVLTEAGTKKRASLHVVRGVVELHRFDAGGIDPLTADLASFRSVLTRENHTLKRTLTDPRLFSGIGNAYSDEILHRARLSPILLKPSWARTRSHICMRPLTPFYPNGSIVCARRPARVFPSGSPPFERTWQCTGDIESRALSAPHRFSVSCTLRTKPTTAPRAKREGNSLPTERCLDC